MRYSSVQFELFLNIEYNNESFNTTLHTIYNFYSVHMRIQHTYNMYKNTMFFGLIALNLILHSDHRMTTFVIIWEYTGRV